MLACTDDVRSIKVLFLICLSYTHFSISHVCHKLMSSKDSLQQLKQNVTGRPRSSLAFLLLTHEISRVPIHQARSPISCLISRLLLFSFPHVKPHAYPLHHPRTPISCVVSRLLFGTSAGRLSISCRSSCVNNSISSTTPAVSISLSVLLVLL